MKVTDEMIKAFRETPIPHGWKGDELVRARLRAVLDLIEAQRRPGQHDNPNLINLRGVSEESTIITMDRAAYEAAKRDGTLVHELDVYLSDMDGETYVIEPDGTKVYPYA